MFFYFRGDRLIRIMNILESPHLHYLPHQGKQFYPDVLSKQYKRKGIKWTMLFFMLAHATLSSSYIPPTMTAISYSKGHPESTLPEKLPYYSWMPFEFNTSTTYLKALGYQAIPMFSYAYSIVGMDTLFMNIMNCIALNLDIIQGAFLTVVDRASMAVRFSFDK
ncbi:unnamed protein product [Acanthoscelides obtectus]|uniref:Uncharacterized protein n=1 Tax=Acanthoscelides obtectus TaxID=200917 RepID=A0A9P0K834_ACAOB|nr:unnamed protein product [Acanthoscelides obtectus]CAK1623072.1 hypothetical protein AOBTE_LOCUS1801 [Acanthoscelides obtectus]